MKLQTRTTQKHAYKDYTETHTRADIHTMAYTLDIHTRTETIASRTEQEQKLTQIEQMRQMERWRIEARILKMVNILVVGEFLSSSRGWLVVMETKYDLVEQSCR